MQCRCCQFENIPGVTACFRCGSALGNGGPGAEALPPRASRGAKSLRPLWNRLRRRIRRKPAEAPADMPEGFGSTCWLLSLSAVPGLAAVVLGRFRSVRGLWLAWLASLGVGLLLLGSQTGMMLIGLAIGLHAMLTVDVVFGHTRLRWKTLAFVLIGTALFFGYQGVADAAARSVHMVLSNADYPGLNVRSGDLLLARRRQGPPVPIPRGELVIATAPWVGIRNINGHGSVVVGTYGYETLGQIVGLPGDSVELEAGQLRINGRPAGPGEYRIPDWLADCRFCARVPERRYFIVCEYRVNYPGRELRLTDDLVRQICVLREDAIRARLFMRWLPLQRRGRLREAP